MKVPNLFNNFVNHFRMKAKLFTDKRKGKNTTYKITDIVLSAFSLFFFQSESFLAFLLHTVLRLVDKKFNGLFEKSPRYEIFREMEVLTKFFYFEDIELLIDLILNNDKNKLRLASDYVHSRKIAK